MIFSLIWIVTEAPVDTSFYATKRFQERLSVRPSVCPSVRLSVRPSERPPDCPSACPSVPQSVRPTSINLFVQPSIYLLEDASLTARFCCLRESGWAIQLCLWLHSITPHLNSILLYCYSLMASLSSVRSHGPCLMYKPCSLLTFCRRPVF